MEMESRLSGQDIAFDGPIQDDEDQVTATPADYLSDMRMEPASLLEPSDSESQMKQRLFNTMQGLDERIRQIEKSAMNKLKAQLA
jgi:RNA polymerase sigma-32 factor